MPETKKTAKTELKSGAVPKVTWDDTQMRTSYANVCNVAGTREEVALLFGTNQTGLNAQEVSVRLSDRVILSPFAAQQRRGRVRETVRLSLDGHDGRHAAVTTCPSTGRPAGPPM
jgi:hypothetical protein